MKHFYLRHMLLLCLCLFAGIKANARTYDAQINGIFYNFISDTEAEVTSPGNATYSGNVVIPSSVTYNGNTYNVIKIGNSAFNGCRSLASVTIPESVKYIDGYAFYNCMALTSVKIPDEVMCISDFAFCYCRSLTSITIPDNVTSIGDNAFEYCNGLTSIIIPNSVTTISEYAFANCRGLTSITLSSNLTSIGDMAFEYCIGLTSITIPKSVTSLGRSVFSECTGLTSVHISDLTAWCNISFGDGWANPLTYAQHLYINGQEINDLVIPDNVTNIGNFAFSPWEGMTSVTIPNSVTSIGDYAFSGCNGLTSIIFPNSVTTIGDHAFSYCEGLTSITIPNSMTSICSYAFEGCVSLTSVTSQIVEPFGYSGYYNNGQFIYTYEPFRNISSDCVLIVPKGTRAAYIAKGWTESVFKGGVIEGDGLPVTITSAGYATFINTYDMSIPEGLTAFTVTLNSGIVTMTEIDGKIPANTPVVLKGAADTYEFSYTTGAEAVGENGLGYTTAPLVSDGTQYILTNKASHGPGFYKVKAGVTIPAGKVYLQASSTDAKEFFGLGDDDATGIKTLSDSPLNGENIYNLAGQHVGKMQRGINIVNGKKILK